MNYQLVIQYQARPDDSSALEDLIAAEDKLSAIADGFEVDGHDFGSGQMNIFILTSDPKGSYEKIRLVLATGRPWVAAYRETDGDEFVVLGAKDSEPFEIK